MLDSLGIDTPADLRFIYAEDLMEDGITYEEAIKLLQGYQSSGAVRPFISSPAIIRALPVRVHGRFGAIRSRPLQSRRPEPTQSEPISSITLNWSKPRPFHDVFRQQDPPSTNNPLWLEGVNSDVLVHPSVGTILNAPKLQSVIHAGSASSSASANNPPVRTAPALSPREEEEYQKVCEHDEQLMTSGLQMQ